MQGILQQERVVELGSAYCTTICSAPECRIGGRKCREYCSSKRVVNDLEAAGVRRLAVARGDLQTGSTFAESANTNKNTNTDGKEKIQIRNNLVARREGLKCLYQSTSIKKYELSSSFSIPSF